MTTAAVQNNIDKKNCKNII